MKNRDLFLKDPVKSELLNNGVAEVRDIRSVEELKTLRYELETFVCEGQYGRGLSRILESYVKNLDKPEQPAVWVSGFFGSGKSHLVKMLRYLWTDYEFPDDRATARGITRLSSDVTEALKELVTAGRRYGGLHAAAGTLGAGAGESVRLALLGIVFRSVGLPEKYPMAKFVLWLKDQGINDKIRKKIEEAGKNFDKELQNLYVSPVLAQALLSVDQNFATNPGEAKSLLKNQYPKVDDVSLNDMVDAIGEALSNADGQFPCTSIVLDEVQQYIGDNSDRTYKVQEVTEACVKKFGPKLLFVGTGQTALAGTPQLQKLKDRFRIPVQLSDTDVETVIRKIVLAKKPDKTPEIDKVLSECSGEISRHLMNTRIEPRSEDQEYAVADYPLLPVRRRFWELVLRAVDRAGTAGQLRTQLKIVHEAVRAVADLPLGTVVSGDFVYSQLAPDLLQTGVLLREIHEFIQKQDVGTPEGNLRAKLAALIFLIGKIPREEGADTGIRATPDVLADLIVTDLQSGSTPLRVKIPELLKGLVQDGHLMEVGNEYRLQTRESVAWEDEYRKALIKIINDDNRIACDRGDLLRQECGERLKTVRLVQGKSKVPRKIDLFFTQDEPTPTGQTIPIWVRNGWEADEKSVIADARKAGTGSSMVYVFIPRRNADELKKTMASQHAARETLDAKGVPSTLEGLEARAAMDTREHTDKIKLDSLLKEIFNGARVYIGGGTEYTGIVLPAIVTDAATAALSRMFPQFDVADDPRWEMVLQRARKGDGNALESLGYQGQPENHPVCSAILKELGPGKKGSEIRRIFSSSPYGWPQDAIDGAIVTLFVAGQIKAIQNDKPMNLKELDQTKIGVVEFRSEQIVVTGPQRIAIRKLFQEAGLGCKPGEESSVAAEFGKTVLSLAESAGGDPPLPLKPDIKHLQQIGGLSGNEQLVALYNDRDRLTKEIHDWQAIKALKEKRLPRWEVLHRLLNHAASLTIASEIRNQVEAIKTQRSLLLDPDPVPSLCESLTQALRKELVAVHKDYTVTYDSGMENIGKSDIWKRLDPEQQKIILKNHNLASIPEIKTGSETELLQSLDRISLVDWHTRCDALPHRFEKALLEAAKLLEPKAIHYIPPSATLINQNDLDLWLENVKKEVTEHLKKGPVIL
jgi:hypothetical protein